MLRQFTKVTKTNSVRSMASAAQAPLNQELAGIPALNKAQQPSNVQISSLSNGLKVVSQDFGAGVASVGFQVKAGSRYEDAPGTSHVLEHIAFGTTHKRSALKIQRDTEDYGAVTFAKTGREIFAYNAEVLRDGVDQVTEILGEVITQPKLFPWEVKEGKETLLPLLESAETNPVNAIVEGIHAAAYGSNSSLGHNLYARASDFDDITDTTIKSFLGGRFNAKNAVFVGTNVEHSQLVEVADKYFGSLPEGNAAANAAGAKKATVVGGASFIQTSSGPGHVAIALEAPSLNNGKDFLALGVLQNLLGGTGAHGGAAGQARIGPQKQSRLARSVHTEAHSFIRSISAFSFAYSDSGLFGLVGSCADHESGRLVDTMAGFLKDSVRVQATEAELARAKKAFKLAYLAEIDTRNGRIADFAGQVLNSGKVSGVAETLAAIDAVTANDVSQVAKACLASKPSIVAIGSLSTVPRYDVFASLLQ